MQSRKSNRLSKNKRSTRRQTGGILNPLNLTEGSWDKDWSGIRYITSAGGKLSRVNYYVDYQNTNKKCIVMDFSYISTVTGASILGLGAASKLMRGFSGNTSDKMYELIADKIATTSNLNKVSRDKILESLQTFHSSSIVYTKGDPILRLRDLDILYKQSDTNADNMDLYLFDKARLQEAPILLGLDFNTIKKQFIKQSDTSNQTFQTTDFPATYVKYKEAEQAVTNSLDISIADL
jgi:hypothetical protein